MIWNMYKKEIRSWVRSPFSVGFTLLFPVIFILIMGYVLSNVVGETAKVESEETVRVLYLVEVGAAAEYATELEIFKVYAQEGMDVQWQEVTDFEASKELVDTNAAIALIKVSEEGFYYYRSPYNEPAADKVLRAAYNNMLGELTHISLGQVTSTIIEVETVDSYTYFTFAELGFIMFDISLIVGQGVLADKHTKAFRRIYISDASVNAYVAAKVALGVTISVVQIVEVYLVSALVLNVSWGNRIWLIVLTFLFLGLFMQCWEQSWAYLSKAGQLLATEYWFSLFWQACWVGGLTPVTFLESYKVLSYICKISPLYWITNGTVALAGNQDTNEHVIGMLVCGVLTVVLLLLYAKKKKEEQKKGVFVYE